MKIGKSLNVKSIHDGIIPISFKEECDKKVGIRLTNYGAWMKIKYSHGTHPHVTHPFHLSIIKLHDNLKRNIKNNLFVIRNTYLSDVLPRAEFPYN